MLFFIHTCVIQQPGDGDGDGDGPAEGSDGITDWLGAVIKPAYQDKRVVVFANRRLPSALTHAIRALGQFLLDGSPDDAYDRTKIAELLRRQAACQREFGRLVADEVDPLQAQPVLPDITPVFVARGDSILEPARQGSAPEPQGSEHPKRD